jgi:ABC-type bacteriocin/lantibiotic exporter with double-glycine peptidase domain
MERAPDVLVQLLTLLGLLVQAPVLALVLLVALPLFVLLGLTAAPAVGP